MDAQRQEIALFKVVSTDPPYYDNVPYADLSDFFYVWLRRSLKLVFPSLFATLAVPKAEELVATPYRHGSKEAAETFFMEGMTHSMHRLAGASPSCLPSYDLLCLQAVGLLGQRNCIDWLGNFSQAVLKAGFSIGVS